MINILIAASLVGMVAVGHTYLIIAGQNDLSPGSLAAFSGVVAALLVSKGMPFAAAVIVTIVCGAAVGFFNAFMVNKIHLEAFIATLVTQSIIRGFAYIICGGGKPVSISNKTFLLLGKARILNIPVSVWIMIICIVVFGIILAKTKFGRSVYAIGGSMDAARLAGELKSEKDHHNLLCDDGYPLLDRRHHIRGTYELRTAGRKRQPRV